MEFTVPSCRLFTLLLSFLRQAIVLVEQANEYKSDTGKLTMKSITLYLPVGEQDTGKYRCPQPVVVQKRLETAGRVTVPDQVLLIQSQQDGDT